MGDIKKQPGRILIIDDEFQVLCALEKFFKTHGWDVHTAYNTNVAEDLVERHQFDVVVADYNLPESTGLEFLNGLRKKKPWVRGIILTGQKSAIDKSVHNAEGSIYPFLEKPCNLKELMRWADKLMSVSRNISRL